MDLRVNLADSEQRTTALLNEMDYDDEFEESGDEDEVNFSGFFEEVYGHGPEDGNGIDFFDQLVSFSLSLAQFNKINR